jgi:hypothetical protein
MGHEPWILWLTKALIVLENQLADDGYFLTRDGWKRTLQGMGRSRMATEKRTFQQLQSATGGGRAMSLWKKDPDGDDSLIIGKEDLATAIKEKQQELGYTTYNFTRIMKKILTSHTPQQPTDRVHVCVAEEVVT